MKREGMFVSIIIPSYNEEKYIKYPLEGLSHQDYKNFETIVVDAGSTDRTREIAKGKAKVILDKRRGIALGRNIGAKASKGDVFFFLDADTKPSRTAVGAYAKAFEDKSIIAATGPVYPLEGGKWHVKLGYKLVSILFVKFMIAMGVPTVVGANFAVRASTFRRIKGFDTKINSYEDWELSMRLNKQGRIAFLDDASVYTSTRRVKAWGMLGYSAFHLKNMLLFHLFGMTQKGYKVIR